MPIYNADIAAIFDEIADYLEIEGENHFRVRAYRNAARTVQGMGAELKDLVAQDEDLTRLPGIGKELAAKIAEYVTTGAVKALTRLRDKISAEVGQILKLPGLGPKRVRILYHDLNIQSLAQLQQAAEDGRIRSLPGLGQKTEAQILKAVKAHAEKEKRFKIAEVAPYVNSLLAYLEAVSGVKSVAAAGSYRRARETVGDLDILVVAESDTAVMDRFVAYDDVVDVLVKGTTKSSVVLRCGLQVDLRVVAAESFGAALQYFTGSQAHNVAIRQMGRQRGLKINEYGVFKFEEKMAGDSEDSVYQALGLSWVPPELRENRGEIEAAQNDTLPRLVEMADLKGHRLEMARSCSGTWIKVIALPARSDSRCHSSNNARPALSARLTPFRSTCISRLPVKAVGGGSSTASTDEKFRSPSSTQRPLPASVRRGSVTGLPRVAPGHLYNQAVHTFCPYDTAIG